MANPVSSSSPLSSAGGLTIRHKLVAITMGVCSMALLTLSVLIVVFLTSLYRERIVGELAIDVRVIASNSAAAVQFDDARDAAEILRALSARPSVAFASIDRSDGTSLATYQRDPMEGVARLAVESGEQGVVDGWLVAREPVMVDGRVVGTAYMQADQRDLLSFRNYTIRVVAALLAVVLAVAYLLTARLQRFIAGPLEHLTRVTREVSGTRDYSLRAEVVSTGEIASLTQAFNGMLAEIETRDTALQHAQAYITNIINSMPSVLVGVDVDGMVVQWNDGAAHLTGLSQQEAIGKALVEVMPSIAPEMERVQEAVETRQEQYIRREVPGEAEQVRTEEITIFPLGADGIDGVVIRIDDVTERSELEDQLNHTRKMDAVGQLAGGVAHDFNNMLGGIIGGAELLQKWVPDEPKPRKYLGMIMTASERAAGLARQLLAFSRKQKRISTPVDFHKIISDTVAILENTIDKRVRVTLTLDAESTFVIGDPTQLQNVLLNLGINAAQAMPEGGTLSYQTSVKVLDANHCRASAFDLDPGPYLALVVRDTGCGIPLKTQKRIFEPFFTTKGPGKGTGLGLSAAYGIVTQHGGEISVCSEVGVGTCFNIFLPLAEKGDEGAGRLAMTPCRGSGVILLVDDEPIMLASAASCLEECGYTVILAEDGAQAVERYRQRGDEIDVVVCDMIMPNMNGNDCFKALKAINPEVRFILSSGFSRDEDIAEMHSEGLAGAIEKPYRCSELSAAVANAMASDSVL